ncbi:MAG TPA: bifunctional diguanylate cyclase/phosphodiesterase [Steroidobacteraceae bacterium]|nr:bifunctional diguanylate cyclase/phosphodiesterase [Steroidobacteraceae bacterium]
MNPVAKTTLARARLHPLRGPLLLLLAVALLIFVGGLWLSRDIVVNSFRSMEDQQAYRIAKQTRAMLEAELQQLALDARQNTLALGLTNHLAPPDLSWLRRAYSLDAMRAQRADLVWIATESGTTLFSAWRNQPRMRGEPIAVPEATLQQFRPLLARSGAATENGAAPLEQLIATPTGPMAYSVSRLDPGQRSDPAVMVVTMRYLDPTVRRLGERAQQPLQLQTFPSSAVAADHDLGPILLTAPDAAVGSWTRTARAGGAISVQILLHDYAGRPLGVVHARFNASLSAAGQRSAAYLMGLQATQILLLGLAVFLTLMHLRRHAQRQKAEDRRQRVHSRRQRIQAWHDPLTGLANHLQLRARLPRALRRLEPGQQLAVVLLGIDGFNSVNSTLGRDAGDQLLRTVALRMRAAAGETDLLFRLKADEFLLLAAIPADPRHAGQRAERLLAAIQAPTLLNKRPMVFTASIGISLCQDPAQPPLELLQQAESALRRARAQSGNCYRIADPGSTLELRENLLLEQALREAIGSDQFYVEYQPIVDMRSGALLSLEALVRWLHPERGVIAPLRFIPAAERLGLIEALGSAVLEMVIRQLRQWQLQGVPVVPVAVNVSPWQLNRTDFPSKVQELCAAADLDPAWLRFEITESAVVHNSTQLVGSLLTLQAMGSQIQIDDFGTGYSNLGYLTRLPVNTLKIDRSFVNELGQSANATTLVSLIVEMARKLGFGTIAEGVETLEQHAALLELGCSRAQGYFYARPESAQRCEQRLRLAAVAAGGSAAGSGGSAPESLAG